VAVHEDLFSVTKGTVCVADLKLLITNSALQMHMCCKIHKSSNKMNPFAEVPCHKLLVKLHASLILMLDGGVPAPVTYTGTQFLNSELLISRPPLWSTGRVPGHIPRGLGFNSLVLPDLLSSSGSGKGVR
jgi:hypothetical protein